MKRRLLVLAGVTAAEATAMAVCMFLVNRSIDRVAGEIEREYPTPLPSWLTTTGDR